MISKRFSVAKNCLRPEKAPLMDILCKIMTEVLGKLLVSFWQELSRTLSRNTLLISYKDHVQDLVRSCNNKNMDKIL